MERRRHVLFNKEGYPRKQKKDAQTRQNNPILKAAPWVLALFMIVNPRGCNEQLASPEELQPPTRTHILPTPVAPSQPTSTPILPQEQIDTDRRLEMWKEITSDFLLIRILVDEGLFSPPLLEGTSPDEILQWMEEALAKLHNQRLRGPDDEGTTESTTGILEKFLELEGKIVIVTQTPKGNKVTVIGQGGCVEAEVWFESSDGQEIKRTDGTKITLFAIPPQQDRNKPPLYYGPLVKLDAEEIPGKPEIGEPIKEGQATVGGAMWTAMNRALQLPPTNCPQR